MIFLNDFFFFLLYFCKNFIFETYLINLKIQNKLIASLKQMLC